MPLLSAAGIYYIGYSSTFTLMMVFFEPMLAFSFTMPMISLRTHMNFKHQPFLAQLLHCITFKKASIKWQLASSLTAGVFLQFQQLFLLIFTFSVTENKFWIAGLNATYTLATLTRLLIYRRLRLQESVMLLIGVLLLAYGFLIVLFPAKPILILSNLMTAVGIYYFTAGWNTHQFKLIKSYS